MSETAVARQESKHLPVTLIPTQASMSATGQMITGNQVGQPNTGGITTMPSKQSQTTMTEEKSKGPLNFKALTALAASHYGTSTKVTIPMSVQQGQAAPHMMPKTKWLSKTAVPSATVTSNTQPKEAEGVAGVVHAQNDGQRSALANVPGGSSAASQPSTSSGTPLSSKGPGSSQLEVQDVPEFQKGKVNAKLFPPSHYDLCKVEIGSWKHESTCNVLSLGRAKLKAIFSRRKFIYEFEIPKHGLGAAFMGFVQMACIEVPFTSVTGINIAPSKQLCEVSIEVNQPPSMFLGSKSLWAPRGNPGERSAKYDLNTPVDLTDGQLKTCPYHKITVKRCKLKDKLSKFDPRFAALLQIPIKVVPSKVLSPGEKPATLPKKRAAATPRPKPSTAPKKQKTLDGAAATGSSICKCTTGCMSNRCACAKAGGKCSKECACAICKNPFNILGEFGLDLQTAKEDKCLMQNVFKISDLRQMLKEKELELPCCDITVSLSKCCVGVFECPECGYEYSYSWCWGDLCEEECRPRNHCEICKTCGDYRNDHCFNCNKCYFAGCSGFPCPCEERGRGRRFGGFGSLFASLF